MVPGVFIRRFFIVHNSGQAVAFGRSRVVWWASR